MASDTGQNDTYQQTKLSEIMMKTRLNKLLTATAVVLAIGGTNAMAVPVNELFFNQAAGLLDPANDGNAATDFYGTGGLALTMGTATAPQSNANFPANTYLDMSWRSPANPVPSSLTINSFNDTTSNSILASNQILNPDLLNQNTFANGQWNANEWAVITNLRQINNVVTSTTGFPNPLWRADVLANLNIYSDAARTNNVLADLASPTRLEFWETLNQTTCPFNNTGTTCEDRYTVLSTELADESFIFDGNIYTISFTLAGGPGTIIQPDGNFIRVFTPETSPGTSDIYVLMQWNARAIPVPEPTSISLLAVALLGLGVAGRRRKAA